MWINNAEDINFNEIIMSVRQKIPSICKNWTDHNLSDYGIIRIHHRIYDFSS